MAFSLDPIASRPAVLRPAAVVTVRPNLLFPGRTAVSVSQAMTPRDGPACPPLDLAGATLEHPCNMADNIGPCWMDEYLSLRSLYAQAHNKLVDALERFNLAVGEGLTTWTPVPTAAWATYEESWALLEKYPPNWGQGFGDLGFLQLKVPATAFVAMATRVHAAACDVNTILKQLGQEVPSEPAPPKEGETVVEAATNFVKDLAGDAVSGLVKIAIGLGAGAVLLGIGYMIVNRGKR